MAYVITKISNGSVYGVTEESNGSCAREYYLSWVDAEDVTIGDTITSATLHRHDTAEFIRTATDAELAASIEAARHDGGAGVIVVDGVRCYAME